MSFLIGLSQGMTQGILGKQREERDQFYKQQDMLLEQLHNDAKVIRPEDYPKMMEHIHNITVAKDAKQLDQAYGKYRISAITENYGQEQQARDYNANIPTSDIVSGGQLPEQMQNSNPATGEMTVAAPAIRMADEERPIPVEQVNAMKVNPDAYAQGKIRFRNIEGDQARTINIAREKGEIQSKVAVDRETAKAQAKLNEINEKAKTAGLRGVQYGYEDGQLVQMGVDSRGNMVKNPIGDVQLPQSLIADQNNKARKEIADSKLAAQEQHFTATMKLNRDRLANSKKLVDARIKEMDVKVRSGYFNKSGGAASGAAKNLISIAKIKTDGIDKRYAIIEKEIQDIREQQKYYPDNPKFELMIDEKHKQMESLVGDRDLVMQSLEEQAAILDNAPANSGSGGGPGSGSGSGGGGSSPNKKPALKVGNVRSALGLGGK